MGVLDGSLDFVIKAPTLIYYVAGTIKIGTQPHHAHGPENPVESLPASFHARFSFLERVALTCDGHYCPTLCICISVALSINGKRGLEGIYKAQ